MIYEEEYHIRIVCKKIRIQAVNKTKRIAWHRGKFRSPLAYLWDRNIFNDESNKEIATDNRLYVWRKVCEEWYPCCVSIPPGKCVSTMLLIV